MSHFKIGQEFPNIYFCRRVRAYSLSGEKTPYSSSLCPVDIGLEGRVKKRYMYKSPQAAIVLLLLPNIYLDTILEKTLIFSEF